MAIRVYDLPWKKEEEREAINMELFTFGKDFLDHLPVGVIRRRKHQILYSNKVAIDIFNILGISDICMWLDCYSTNPRNVHESRHGTIVVHKEEYKGTVSYQLELRTPPEETIYEAYEKVYENLEEFLQQNSKEVLHGKEDWLQMEAFQCCLHQQKINLWHILNKEKPDVTVSNIHYEVRSAIDICKPWVEKFGCQMIWLKEPRIQTLGKIEPTYFERAMKNIIAYAVSVVQEEEDKTIRFSMIHHKDMEYFSIDIPYTKEEAPKKDLNYNLESAIALLERMHMKPVLVHEGKSIRFLLCFATEDEGLFELLSPTASGNSSQLPQKYPSEVLAFSQLILRHSPVEELEEIFCDNKNRE